MKSIVIAALNKLGALLTPKRILAYSVILTVISWGIFFPTVNLSMLKSHVSPPDRRATDFLAFYTAGLIAGSAPERIYDLEAQTSAQLQIIPTLKPAMHVYYLYPPFFTVVLVPLSKFSYVQAYWVWTAIGIIVYLLSLCLLLSFQPSTRAWTGHILIVAIAAPAFFRCLLLGQTSTLALLLFTVSFYLIKHDKPFFSGLTLGFLDYRIHSLIVLAPTFLLKSLWRVIAGLVVSSVGLTIAGSVFFSVRSYETYIRYISSFFLESVGVIGNFYPFSMSISLYAFFHLLFSDTVAVAFTILAAIPVVYWLVKAWRGSVMPHTPLFDLQFALSLSATLLLMHHSMIYDLLLLTLPAFVIYEHRTLFPPYTKLLLCLLYLAPYYSMPVAQVGRINLVQPLLLWLSYEIYRACEISRDRV